MAKVTEQDVVNFLKEKVSQLTKDLESAQNALNALLGSTSIEAPVKRGRKPKAEGTAPVAKRKMASKAGGAKRGRKRKVKETAEEAQLPQISEQ